MSKKNKKKNGLKIGLFTFIIIAVISGIGYFSMQILGTEKQQEEEPVVKKNESEIEGYGITLDDHDTDLYRSEYTLLKENLESDTIDFSAYAESVAKLFIIDLYTIKNKTNKYDTGGVEFVEPSTVENYKLNVEDTLYKYVEDNTNNTRTQSLPVVDSIEVTKKSEEKFKMESEDKEYQAYKITLTWTYSNDLGYDTKGEVIVINKENKLYVVEKN